MPFDITLPYALINAQGPSPGGPLQAYLQAGIIYSRAVGIRPLLPAQRRGRYHGLHGHASSILGRYRGRVRHTVGSSVTVISPREPDA